MTGVQTCALRSVLFRILGISSFNPYSLIPLALTSSFHVSVLILHGFPLLFSMCFHSVYFPLPCVQFFSSSFSHILASIRSHLCSLFFACVPLRDSIVLRFMFSPLPVRLCFPYTSVISFPFLASGFSHLSSPVVSSSTDDLTCPRSSFDLRFYCLFFEARFLWPAGRNKYAHTPPLGTRRAPCRERAQTMADARPVKKKCRYRCSPTP